jgi:hypothetical protein
MKIAANKIQAAGSGIAVDAIEAVAPGATLPKRARQKS